MSWSNLTDAKNKIVEYICRFQTLEKTKTSPIVVPFGIWVKNAEEFNDTTASRLAFHWLEHIGHIKQRYLSQACLDITINDNSVNTSSLKQDPVYMYIVKNAKDHDNHSLVSMNDMRSCLHMSMSGTRGPRVTATGITGGEGLDMRITCFHQVLMLCSGALLKGVP
jgi:ATP-dependent DNA helicase RecQ